MPAYDYKCTSESCNTITEHTKGINDPDLDKCPECGSLVKRLFTTGGKAIWKCPGSFAGDNRR